MSTKNTGGPAFPRPLSQHDTSKTTKPEDAQNGMTLRDWFAGQALANGAPASEAYKIADDMIKSREE